ncbi:MarR family winged helix-turn-helix transcriptional regulator [Actinokineospora fastidiosa]|uniref:MarR family transcriptional regulator n=1 Tax=Actinokineospora fastidiosa TaxID=1816 RepID=A0A918G2B0_9PSEU|nr:MarR family transcriptional regulator [Actinokineospora fastidiosa]GGS13108.1 MarR family transcriptional regulator [Actinokineospora fastidiosa]
MSDEAVAAVERAMVAIRRSQSRRVLSRMTPADGIDPTLFGVLDVVEERAETCGVGEVAAALGVDQPRASRLVARAVDQGLLTRTTDPTDARRTLLTLTDDGHNALAHAHEARRAVFDQVMADWSATDRHDFARLITRFVASLGRVVPGGD